MATKYWLMKSEPEVYSIDDLARDRKTSWEGVRNYQARNFIRDAMELGDLVLFYHSSSDPPGVAGIARVCREAYPDPSAWDPESEYYDRRSTVERPLWLAVDLEFVEKFPAFVALDAIRSSKALAGMLVAQRGQRLSVQPVEEKEFRAIERMGRSLNREPRR
jgi:predicted RNA-binding protein with PUA-like domain